MDRTGGVMRVVFMGTPEFSVPPLEALIAAGHDVVAVYTQPPRPAGRGKKDRPGPVHARALELGIEVRHPANLKSDEARSRFAALDADVAVVVAYGLLLPQVVLDAPARGCLNIHASLLPRWRGAAPIHRAIMAGDDRTGVCVMQMEAGLDTGPVLLRRSLEIGPEETTGALHDRLSELGAMAIVEALADLDALQARPQPQPDTGITYASKIDKSEAQVDFDQPASVVSAHIRGLSPFPGAWAMIGETRVKFLGARAVPGEGEAGRVIGPGLTIACRSGAIEVTRAQRAGKAAQDMQEFLRGFPVEPGTKLEG